MDENDFKRLLEESAAETHRRIDTNAAETREQFAETRNEFAENQKQFAENREQFSETRKQFAAIAQRFDQIDARFDQIDARFEQVDTRAAGLKQHIDETARRIEVHVDIAIEDLRKDIRGVAEGVLTFDEKLDREAADIRAEMRQGFADTQAMLRVSRNDLDRRVTKLERAAK